MSATDLGDRAGRWLFHRHLLAHMSGAQRLARVPNASGTTAVAAAHRHGGGGRAHAAPLC